MVKHLGHTHVLNKSGFDIFLLFSLRNMDEIIKDH